MAGKDYANTRFSELNQITVANVEDLKLAFSFSTGTLRGHEAAPVVVGGTMYSITPYPNIVYAPDLTRPGAPAKWKYAPKPLAAAQGVACCDVVIAASRIRKAGSISTRSTTGRSRSMPPPARRSGARVGRDRPRRIHDDGATRRRFGRVGRVRHGRTGM